MSAPVDVLAVLYLLDEVGRDIADLDADAYIDLTDERHEELDARYGDVPRAAKMSQASLRMLHARAGVIAARAAVADAIAANVAMLAALDEAFGINAMHDDERIYDELPSSAVASAYFMARAAIARCKGESA